MPTLPRTRIGKLHLRLGALVLRQVARVNRIESSRHTGIQDLVQRCSSRPYYTRRGVVWVCGQRINNALRVTDSCPSA